MFEPHRENLNHIPQIIRTKDRYSNTNTQTPTLEHRYNDAKDRKTENLVTPLVKDSFQIWQRSWAVLRIKPDHPGFWPFHCHMEQHIPLGMMFALNILPSKVPAIPSDVPTEGPCMTSPSSLSLMDENTMLTNRVKELEKELASKCSATA